MISKPAAVVLDQPFSGAAATSVPSEWVIKVENLGKKYRVRHQESERYVALRDVLAAKAKSLLRRRSVATSDPEDFWALRGLSFEVKQGEVLGIVGRNGAGKSTLLKILSRITEPTEGRVRLRGRVASLLEVGTGFHPELTGRENIFLNGAVLGMDRAEIRRKFNEIVSFAEVERFLDTPVKRYSSGMYVRLAFAVAAHLEPEILVVDEVLAVGDSEFQKKCLGKMQDVSRGGRTVLVVSHNFGLIRSLCTAGVALDRGRIIAAGGVDEAIGSLPKTTFVGGLSTVRFTGPLKDAIRFERLRINGQDPHETEIVVSPHEPLDLQVEFEVTEPLKGRLTVALFSDGNRLLSAFDTPRHEEFTPGKWRSRFQWPARFLRPRLYGVALGAYSRSKYGPYVWAEDIALFQIGAEWTDEYEEVALGLINSRPTADRKRLS